MKKGFTLKHSVNKGFTLKHSVNKGFTLIEILVSLALSSIVFVIVSTVLLTLFTANTKSRRSENLLQVKNDVFTELSNSIRWADTVVITDPNSSLTVDTSVYTLDNGALLKNGISMTPNNVEVTSMTIRESVTVPADLTGHSPFPGIEVELEFKDRLNGISSDTLKVFIVKRKLEVNI